MPKSSSRPVLSTAAAVTPSSPVRAPLPICSVPLLVSVPATVSWLPPSVPNGSRPTNPPLARSPVTVSAPLSNSSCAVTSTDAAEAGPVAAVTCGLPWAMVTSVPASGTLPVLQLAATFHPAVSSVQSAGEPAISTPRNAARARSSLNEQRDYRPFATAGRTYLCLAATGGWQRRGARIFVKQGRRGHTRSPRGEAQPQMAPRAGASTLVVPQEPSAARKSTALAGHYTPTLSLSQKGRGRSTARHSAAVNGFLTLAGARYACASLGIRSAP